MRGRHPLPPLLSATKFCSFKIVMMSTYNLNSGRVAVTNKAGRGFETKAAVNQVFSRPPLGGDWA